MVKEYDRLSLDTTRFSGTLDSESHFQLFHGSRKLSLLNRTRENLTRVVLFYHAPANLHVTSRVPNFYVHSRNPRSTSIF